MNNEASNFYSKTSRLFKGIAAICLLASAFGAAAQDYPNKPIRWIVPFAAGGGGDTLARLYSHEMEKTLKQPFVIENKPGASTLIGVQALLAAKADGYVVFGGNDSLATNLYLLEKVPYTLNDFAGVSVLVKGVLALVSRPEYPARTAVEALRYIKANDGKLAYGSWGIGGTAHLAMEALLDRIGATMVHAPYPGTAPSITGMLGGQVDIMFADLATAAPYIKSGKLKLWAVGDKVRHPSFPDVPTIAESGYPGFDWFSWSGVLVRKDTPPEAIAKLNKAIVEVTNNKEFRQDQINRGNIPWGSTPKELEELLVTNARDAKAIIEKRDIRVK